MGRYNGYSSTRGAGKGSKGLRQISLDPTPIKRHIEMTKIEKLRKLAEEAIPDYDGQLRPIYWKAYELATTPQTILALLDLVELQRKAIYGLSCMTFKRKPDMRCVGNHLNVRNWEIAKVKADEAYEQFNKGATT